MKTAVVYKSKYGTTRTYAGWIAEGLEAELFEAGKVKPRQLADYDTVIFGGPLYAGRMTGASSIAGLFDGLKSKNLVVFMVGLSDPENEEVYKPIIDRHFTPEMKDKIAFFKFKGRMDFNKLGFAHKTMLKIVKSMMEKSKPEGMDGDAKMFVDSLGEPSDYTDRAAIEPLLCHVRELASGRQ